jgi:hypothetical protein
MKSIEDIVDQQPAHLLVYVLVSIYQLSNMALATSEYLEYPAWSCHFEATYSWYQQLVCTMYIHTYITQHLLVHIKYVLECIVNGLDYVAKNHSRFAKNRRTNHR